MMKWAIELSEFDIMFKIRAVVKGRALANFVVEFAHILEMEDEQEHVKLLPRTCLLMVLLEKQGLGQE